MKAFISYSHDDDEFLEKLHKHLAALRRQNLIETWTDREIDAGGVIDEEISAAIEAADIFILLVSSSFINSDYCFKKEFQRALEKQKAGKALIVPVVIRPCDWKIPELRQFKALPKDGMAVDSNHWHNTDEAFTDVSKGLRSLLEKNKNEPKSKQIKPTGDSQFAEPSLPLAKELLDLILKHPTQEEQGLTEILRDSPEGVLFRAFIPNTTARGEAPSVKKSLFAPAVAELVRLGWLLHPEGNHALRIYELNPDSRRPAQ